MKTSIECRCYGHKLTGRHESRSNDIFCCAVAKMMKKYFLVGYIVFSLLGLFYLFLTWWSLQIISSLAVGAIMRAIIIGLYTGLSIYSVGILERYYVNNYILSAKNDTDYDYYNDAFFPFRCVCGVAFVITALLYNLV